MTGDQNASHRSSTKQLKEDFVSNLYGSSKLEIVALSALVPALVILRNTWYSADNRKNENAGMWTSLALDFFYIVLPTLLALTVFSDYVYVLATTALVVVGVNLFMQKGRQEASQVQVQDTSSKKPFLSYYRFTMMLVTCVTILAVDFNIFPRRYAKTETYGTGLMDLGVGSFVAANAMVSRQARIGGVIKDSGVLKKVAPLLFLGFARLLATRGVDYQVHVGEYGVHWNFFFTLAAVSLLTSLIRIPASHCGALGFGILTVHQASLYLGLNSYLGSSERGSGIIDLNKEGLFSIPGYWGLYLLSLQLGRHLFANPGGSLKRFVPKFAHKDKGWLTTAEICILDIMLWLLVFLLETFVESVSRRTCNITYVAFVLAHNLEVIALFSLADVFHSKRLALLQAFDNNMLFTFLVANVLTGLVNLLVDTIFSPPLTSCLILTGYMALLAAMAGVFQALKIKLNI